MNDELAPEVIRTLAALAVGSELFINLETDALSVKLSNGEYPISGDHLAQLEARALVSLGQNDDANMPREIKLTAWGETFIRRHLLATDRVIIFRPRS